MNYTNWFNNNSNDVEFALLNDHSMPSSQNSIQQKVNKAVQYLYHIRESKAIINDTKAVNSLKFLSLVKDLDNITIKYEHITNILAELFVYFIDYIKSPKLSENGNGQGDTVMSLLKLVMSITCEATDRSRAFCADFHFYNGTNSLIKLLDNETYKLLNDEVLYVEALCILFHVYTRIEVSYVDVKNHKVNTLLSKFITKNFKPSKLFIIACMVYVMVANEQELDTFLCFKFIIGELSNMMKIAVKAIEDKIGLKRKRFSYDETIENIAADGEVCSFMLHDIRWNLGEILISIDHVAINDNKKKEIYEIPNFQLNIKFIVKYGTEAEKLYATNVLWKLCSNNTLRIKSSDMANKRFDLYGTVSKNKRYDLKKNSTNAKCVIEKTDSSTEKNENVENYRSLSNSLESNKNKVKSLETVETKIEKFKIIDSPSEHFNGKNRDDYLNQKIHRNMDHQSKREIIKMHRNGSKESDNKNSFDSNSSHDSINTSKGNDHIMISYNSKSRDLCIKIKDGLEAAGFKVWIDIECIYGSSLESMARAIEKSFCFLMCMSEKYKLSANCMAEAEYAYKLKKPIIPIRAESNYNPDGWLGLLLGSKIYVDFASKPFEQAFKVLLNQINLSVDENSANSRN